MVKKVTSLRVKQSMWSMMIGRPLSALGGFGILVLLSRSLNSSEYGQYFSIWAIAEILILASNLGLLHAVYRYVSADENLDGLLTLHGPLWKLVGWRIVSLVPVVAMVPLFPEVIGKAGGASITPQLSLLLATVVAGEGMSRFLEAIFDSMLCQGRSQITLVSRTLFRLFGYFFFMRQGAMQLHHVLLVEALATASGAVLGGGLLLDLWHRAKKVEGKETWRLTHMLSFAFPAFIAQVLTLTYGPDALKLILADVAGATTLAVFGFAFSLAAVVQRYIPVNLLAGVFRPVFVNAATRPDAEDVLSVLVGTCVKISWLVILPILCFLWCGGSDALGLISGGNYPQAGPIVTIVVVGLLLIAIHLTLSMYCVAIGLSMPMLGATIASISSLPIAIFLARRYGATGIAVAFSLSELIWAFACYILLWIRRTKYLQLDWMGFLKLLSAAFFAMIFSSLLNQVELHWLLVSAVSVAVFMLFSWLLAPFSPRELSWLVSVMPGGKRLDRLLARRSK